MKIPKKIRVGGHEIKVELASIRDYGDFDPSRGVIRLNQNHIRSIQEATFFHELFHTINSQFGADQPTHIMLDSFAEQLYQVLSQNKMLR